MPNEKAQFVIVKLRSGDELVAQLTESSKDTVRLMRPLQMQRTSLYDTNTSQIKKNICVFRDWLEFSTDLECELPRDTILTMFNANDEIVRKYKQELEFLDTGSRSMPKKNAKEDEITDLEKEANDILMREAMRLLHGNPPMKSDPSDKGSFINQTNLGQNVTATFSMPPDVFLNIVLNMPMFDGWGQDMPDDGEDFGSDDDSEDEPRNPTPPPPPNRKAKKKKPDSNSEDDPPKGWNGRFGFPK
jgi:hypothetical protein